MSAGAMTFEQAMALLDKSSAESRVKMEMTFEQAMALLDKKSAESRVNMEMTFEQAMALLDKKSAERRAEVDKFLARIDASLARMDAADKERKVERKKADEKFDRMQKSLGSFQRNLGEMVEFMLIPKVRQKINQYGHKFNVLSPNKQFMDNKTGEILKEVDLMLENCEEVLALEIKSNCKVKDVEKHLRLLRYLRQNESTTGMTNRVLYAGVAGITISESARKSALASGMYVIVIHEEDERVDVIPPETEGRW